MEEKTAHISSLVPNTTQVPHIIIRKWMRDLSDTELRVILVIVDQTLGWELDSIAHTRKKEDWIAYSQLRDKTGRENAALRQALKGLEERGVISVTDGKGRTIPLEQRNGKKLYYRITTFSESEEVNSNLFGKRNSESENTKETYTKELNNGATPHSGIKAIKQLLEEKTLLRGHNNSKVSSEHKYYGDLICDSLHLEDPYRARVIGYIKQKKNGYSLQDKANELLNKQRFLNMSQDERVRYLIGSYKKSL